MRPGRAAFLRRGWFPCVAAGRGRARQRREPSRTRTRASEDPTRARIPHGPRATAGSRVASVGDGSRGARSNPDKPGIWSKRAPAVFQIRGLSWIFEGPRQGAAAFAQVVEVRWHEQPAQTRDLVQRPGRFAPNRGFVEIPSPVARRCPAALSHATALPRRAPPRLIQRERAGHATRSGRPRTGRRRSLA